MFQKHVLQAHCCLPLSNPPVYEKWIYSDITLPVFYWSWVCVRYLANTIS